MPIGPSPRILQRAFASGYGVAAINIVNDLTMEAVLAAATAAEAPLIVQTSVKTVQSSASRSCTRCSRRWRATCRCPSPCTSTTAPTARSSPPASRRGGSRCCSMAPG